MQEYLSSCDAVSKFFDNANIASIVHSYMTPCVFTAHVYKNFNLKSLGIYSTIKGAIRAILHDFVKNNVIHFREKFLFQDDIDVSPSKQEYDELVKNVQTKRELLHICQLYCPYPGCSLFDIKSQDVLD